MHWHCNVGMKVIHQIIIKITSADSLVIPEHSDLFNWSKLVKHMPDVLEYWVEMFWKKNSTLNPIYSPIVLKYLTKMFERKLNFMILDFWSNIVLPPRHSFCKPSRWKASSLKIDLFNHQLKRKFQRNQIMQYSQIGFESWPPQNNFKHQIEICVKRNRRERDYLQKNE